MKPCFVGVDFGKTNMRFAVAEDEPALTYYTKRPYTRGSPDEVSRQMADGIDLALKEAGYTEDGIRGIGIAVPAVVNRKTGAIVWGPDWSVRVDPETLSVSERVLGGVAVPYEQLSVGAREQLGILTRVAAAQRRGIVDEGERKRHRKDADNLAPGFRISGLGQLVETGIEAERLVTFGD